MLKIMVFNGVALDEALGDLIFEGKGHSYKIENVNMERMGPEEGVNWLYAFFAVLEVIYEDWIK